MTGLAPAALVADLAPALLGRRDVVAVGGGTVLAGGRRYDEPCITAFVREKRPASSLAVRDVLPRTVPGLGGERVRVDVVAAGRLTAPPPLRIGVSVPTDAVRTKIRPAPGGVSAANARFVVGTIAIRVRDATDEQKAFALSCNHVFGEMGGGRPGEPVLQPAVLDGGTAGDWLGDLVRTAPLVFDGVTPQRVDAAVVDCAPSALSGGLVDGAQIVGSRDPRELRPGARVHKIGRTTGRTAGEVLATNVWTRIDYSFLGFPGRVVLYHDQIATTGMGAFGDSGSLLVDETDRAVGLLFSGSAGTTIHNPIPAVLVELGASLDPDIPALADATPPRCEGELP